jgi:hypothetical protein
MFDPIKDLTVVLRSAKIDLERFNLRQLNDIEMKARYQVEISNRISALEDLNDDVDISSVGERIKRIRERIKQKRV